MVDLPSTTCTLIQDYTVRSSISSTFSIFGPHKKRKLPVAAAIPLRFAYRGELGPASSRTKHLLNVLSEVEPVSYAHSVNLAAHAYNFGRFIHLTNIELNQIYYGALMHDVGKIYFDDLLQAPRKLTPMEIERVRQHVLASYIILSKNHYSRFIRISGLYHHFTTEQYPKCNTSLYVDLRTVSAEIGISSQSLELIRYEHLTSREKYLISIISLLDIFDALIDINRPYKKGIPLQECIEILAPMWGTKFPIALKGTFLQYALWLMHYPQPTVVPYVYERLEPSL